jgi:YegS/Rv2252/BmrU family lipid kinase
VIVNPSSRSGATGRRIPELERLLQIHVGDFRLLPTAQAGDGERLALEAALQGATRVIVAGGDGTVSEVVSGLLRSADASDIELGLLPLGTGHDFARLLKLGTNLEAAVARLASGQRRVVDAGRIRCPGRRGDERVRCFLNIASLGLSGESVLWLADRGKRGKRGPLSYLMSGVVGLIRYQTPEVSVRLDERLVHSGRLALLAAANGQFFAGGMRVAPDAQIDDGQFDVVIVQGMSKPVSLLHLATLLTGSHVRSSNVRVHHGRSLRIESVGEVWVEADGEPIGTLPATIELLPAAIRLCGLPE